ncbi:MAG: hypothetical protein FWC95_08295, partial [Defluviitaleaceae bacterium]|nr:hypothetical protein [Defluviitaleaceae bacterium]
RKAEEEARKRKVAEERKHKIAEEEHRKKQERIKLMELLLRLEEMKMDDALFLLLLWLKSEYGYEW